MSDVADVLFEIEQARSNPLSPFNNPSHPDWDVTVACVELLQEWLWARSEEIPNLRPLKDKRKYVRVAKSS